jgi:hypothetical protein
LSANIDPYHLFSAKEYGLDLQLRICHHRDSEYTFFSKQNESWGTNHWDRGGDETITIQWVSGKRKSFKIGKDAHVIVYDDAVGTSNVNFVQA